MSCVAFKIYRIPMTLQQNPFDVSRPYHYDWNINRRHNNYKTFNTVNVKQLYPVLYPSVDSWIVSKIDGPR